MSTITTIYDQILTELGVILPNHTVIPNAYSLTENSDKAFFKGYGVAVGPGENGKRLITGKYDITRSILISIVRKTFAGDFQAKDTAVKNILEDQILILAEAAKNDNFGLGSSVASFQYESDAGVELLTDEAKFIKIDTVFSVVYFEDIS